MILFITEVGKSVLLSMFAMPNPGLRSGSGMAMWTFYETINIRSALFQGILPENQVHHR